MPLASILTTCAYVQHYIIYMYVEQFCSYLYDIINIRVATIQFFHGSVRIAVQHGRFSVRIVTGIELLDYKNIQCI
jgi:hypothetical protein